MKGSIFKWVLNLEIGITFFCLQLWNSVGIIRQYNTEEESSVDVEFHNTSTHHALHINNSAGFSLAALSEQVVALATEADEDEEEPR